MIRMTGGTTYSSMLGNAPAQPQHTAQCRCEIHYVGVSCFGFLLFFASGPQVYNTYHPDAVRIPFWCCCHSWRKMGHREWSQKLTSETLG